MRNPIYLFHSKSIDDFVNVSLSEKKAKLVSDWLLYNYFLFPSSIIMKETKKKIPKKSPIKWNFHIFLFLTSISRLIFFSSFNFRGKNNFQHDINSFFTSRKKRKIPNFVTLLRWTHTKFNCKWKIIIFRPQALIKAMELKKEKKTFSTHTCESGKEMINN